MKNIYFIIGVAALFGFGCAKNDGYAPGAPLPSVAPSPAPAPAPAPTPPPPHVFAPTDISSIYTWFDASDSSTLTTVSGTQVSAWAAKNDGTVQFTQGTASSRPAIQPSGLNGLNTVRFDGVNDVMQASINSAVSSSVTVSFVLQMNSFSSKIPFSFNTTVYNYGPDLYFFGGHINWNIGDSGGNPFANSIIPTTSAHIYTIKNDQTNNRSKLYVDGSFVGLANYRNSSITDFTSPRLFIGNWVSGSYFIDGQFGELLIYNKVIDETERSDLEAYLKSKWGIP